MHILSFTLQRYEIFSPFPNRAKTGKMAKSYKKTIRAPFARLRKGGFCAFPKPIFYFSLPTVFFSLSPMPMV